MKTLLILRHAKSSWDHPELDDHDRPLNGRGRNDAPRMGRLMHAEGLVPDAMVASTAVRACTTATMAGEACGFEGPVRLSRDLYLAGVPSYLAILAACDDGWDRVLVVGHNPDMERLVLRLTGKGVPMPTAALAHVELPIERWADLATGGDGTGRLVHHWRPRLLD